MYPLKHNVAYQELYHTAVKLIINRYSCWSTAIISLFRHCYRFFMFSCDLIPALTVFSKFLGSFPSCSNSLLEKKKNFKQFRKKYWQFFYSVFKMGKFSSEVQRKTNLSWNLIWGQNSRTIAWIVTVLTRARTFEIWVSFSLDTHTHTHYVYRILKTFWIQFTKFSVCWCLRKKKALTNKSNKSVRVSKV